VAALKRRKTFVELLGVPEPPREGPLRLVYAAIEMIYSHGFQAVGVDQVIAAAGVSKTTFYKHFESRDDLLVAALKLREEWESKAFDAAVNRLAKSDPRASLLAIFDVLDHWFNGPDFNGCQFINAAAEFPNPHHPVHAVAAEHKRRQRDGFRDLAGAAGAADRDAFADQFAALVEGTLILRQVHGRNDAARVVRPAAESLVEKYLPLPQASVVSSGSGT
jgi:AcrR family transcriptional regulator